MIVLDASPLIAYFEVGDALHDRAVACLRALGGSDLGISSLTLAELLVGPTRNGAIDIVLTGLDRLGVEEIALPPDAAIRLARLRVETRLKLPDCCVLLAAQQARADVLTFDRRLVAAAADLGLAVVAG